MVPVLYEDNHLLVVYKPHGLLTQADQTGDEDLLSLSKAYIKEKYNKPGKVYLGLVHRLDRPTAGVMVLARTSKAARRLSQQFKERRVQKYYCAHLESGAPLRGRAEDYLLKEDRTVRVVTPKTPGGQLARLSWTRWYEGPEGALLDIHLETGRSHQIRVQLAHHHAPLVGDLRYGAQTTFDGKNLALHCYHLGFEHPTLRSPVRCILPPQTSWGSRLDEVLNRHISREMVV